MKQRETAVHQCNGFALVVTVSLLVLLSVIALGFLSLSAVTLRSGSHEKPMEEARANARLALQIAIGELQKHTGADTRVTASASIVDETYPPVLGVWRSWEGTNHDSDGRPIAPAYSEKDQAEASGGRFLNWLVSSAAHNTTPGIDDAPALVQTTADDENVPLLAAGSLGDDPRQIHVVPTKLEDRGRYAWWISGENQKARLAQPYHPRTANVAGLAEMGQSHTIANPEAFGLPELLDDPELHDPAAAGAKPARKAVSRQTMSLVKVDNATKPQDRFHDLSSWSVGLLTNTATGGWRKDLSLLTERWDAIYAAYPDPGRRLPLFRYSPSAGDTSQVPKPVMPAATALTTNNAAVTAATPPQSNLYPWSDYSQIMGVGTANQPNTYHAASASWQSLANFVTAYKSFSGSNGGAQTPFVWDAIADSTNLYATTVYNYKHTQRLYPQIARFQFIVYARAVQTSAVGANPIRYGVELLYCPVFTLWNPYNVGLTLDVPADPVVGAYGFGWRRGLPGAMAVVNQATYPDPDLVPSNQYSLFVPGNFQYLDVGGNHNNQYDTYLLDNVGKFRLAASNRCHHFVDMRTTMCSLPAGTLTFKPGEAKVFSPGPVITAGFGGTGIGLREGYDPANVYGRVTPSVAGNLQANQRLWFLLRTDKMTQPYKHRNPGLGFSLSFGKTTGPTYLGQVLHSGIDQEYHNLTALAAPDEGNTYWPPDEVDEVGYSVGELAGLWTPVFSMSMGPRTTIGTGPGTKQNRPTKGVLQSNPLAAMALVNPVSGNRNAHPANGTFDITYHSLTLGSTLTPNLSESKGFIATGYQSGDGLSRLIMCNIPLRPMVSLVELEGWNPRGHNPYPPFQANLIGNSDATPLIPQEQVVPSTMDPPSIRTNLMHDDAYCANHLLFDDWFVSSIAPDPEYFGQTIARDINTVYRDFLKGESRLANRPYLPIAEDSNLSDAEAATRISEVITSHDGWLKVASRFEVEGMFNVNSTSVEAWKALLGHAKSLEQIAMHGADDVVSADVSDEHVVARGAIAPDIKAGTGAGFGAQFAQASEYTGYRSLTDTQINDLAEKVVEQVRLRGPFLSLSEFVNRQLGSDKDLALAGAIQSAINNLETDPMATLRNPANSLSDRTMMPADPDFEEILNGVAYAFPEAAEGDSAYGAPGWIRQADILRPIAPILSVRDDTFTIRAYGDSLDQSGSVVARAWCEAVVKRTREFSADSDAADSVDPPAMELNTIFGRRYEIVSFRWLHEDEV